jgi:hypothetical protein
MYAHHGNAAYDKKNTVTVTGTVAELLLANPHSTVALDVKDEKGNVNRWKVEFGVLRDLWAQGWTQDTLKPGDQIKVAFHPRKNGDSVGILVGGITYADGRAILLHPPEPQRVVRPMHW